MNGFRLNSDLDLGVDKDVAEVMLERESVDEHVAFWKVFRNVVGGGATGLLFFSTVKVLGGGDLFLESRLGLDSGLLPGDENALSSTDEVVEELLTEAVSVRGSVFNSEIDWIWSGCKKIKNFLSRYRRAICLLISWISQVLTQAPMQPLNFVVPW